MTAAPPPRCQRAFDCSSTAGAGKKRQKSGHKPWCDFNTTRQDLAGWIMLVSGNRKCWMRMCRNSVLVFVQDLICAREAWNYVWSTHVFGAVHQAKKGPGEGEFFCFSCCSLSRRRVGGAVGGWRTASWATVCRRGVCMN